MVFRADQNKSFTLRFNANAASIWIEIIAFYNEFID